MECAKLKRALDCESVNQPPTKRRRYNPFGQSGNNSPSRSGASDASSSAGASSTTTEPSNRYAKESAELSPFSESALAKMSPDKMAENFCNEIKRLHKRKQLPTVVTSSSLERMQDSESSGSEMGPESPHRPDSPPSHLMRHHGDKALFTFKEVQLICEGMIKEREDQLRERYESVLTTKLAEQYDVFVKFTYDQIQRRYEAAPSYLS